MTETERTVDGEQLSKSDLRRLTSSLEKHHAIFYKLWNVGTPRLTDEVETACVTFDEEGFFIEFLFNRDLWNDLDDNGKLFLISHECLHLILNHGSRGKGVNPKNRFRQQCLNIAMDFVVNHMLTFHFHFDRSELGSFFNNICWIDTFFLKPNTDEKKFYYEFVNPEGRVIYNSQVSDDPVHGLNLQDRVSDDQKISHIDFYEEDVDGNNREIYKRIIPEKSFEYYYREVRNYFESEVDMEGSKILDEHSRLPDIMVPEGEFYQDPVEEVVEEASDDLYDSEKEELNDILEQDEVDDGSGGNEGSGAGTAEGNGIYYVPVYDEAPDYTWTEIADNCSEKVFKEVERTSWTRKNRRFSFMESDLLLPNTYFKEERVRDNIKVWVFQDVSGSCTSYKDYFFNAITTIPEDKFDMRAFCFSKRCKEMSLEDRRLVNCGGGTNFNPINHKIEKLIREEDCKYPDLVFLITDGKCWDTNRFKRNCKYPERWKMFFPERHSKKAVMDEMDWYLLKNLSEE